MFNEWYLARDKGNSFEALVVAYPTIHTSITKRRGCTEYIPSNQVRSATLGTYCSGWALTTRDCKKIFGHCPKKGELLCVKKTRKGWKSEKIELDFS